LAKLPPILSESKRSVYNDDKAVNKTLDN